MTEQNACSEMVVVANRLPVRAEITKAGTRWVSSPGGLVAAVAPALSRMKHASWVGWSGLANGAVTPFEHNGVRLVPVRLQQQEIERFYEGFSNACLWPLYHDSIEAPGFHRIWWDSYVNVNRKFAEAAAQAAAPGATVWVHDYQLQLVPRMLRELRPDLRIGFFLHIPFPARELFLRIPWRRQIVEGMLGADVIGFQTSVTAHNFRYVAPRVSRATSSGKVLNHEGRSILVGTFPIGIDADRNAEMAKSTETASRVEEYRELLGNPRKVLLGVDRLDYTKGIALRLQAVRELFDEGRLDPADTAVVQIAEPSRGNVPGYQTVQAEVERLAGGINGDYSSFGTGVINYQHQTLPFRDLVALYRLADVMLVTPFRDGMNLVAKEYVASRTDHTGALVLSEFAGAAVELRQAILVNPYDIEDVKDAIETAVNLPVPEQRRRMIAMGKSVHRNSATAWAESFLAALAQFGAGSVVSPAARV
ncbi:MAG: trehalose-6-phosphate synthase [Actinobacteria bacterium]|nr:trehalose-6-phosphate synthase [Actinomycetota bacterium]